MMYVLEKGVDMPLCAVINDVYFNFFDGRVINNVEIIKFIMNGLKTKKMEIRKLDLKIYVIQEYIMPTYDRAFIAYNYCINGMSNYLSYYKQPIKDVHFIKNKLMNGEYFQKLIWGEENE